jgi:GPI-anchor transamidase subunit S
MVADLRTIPLKDELLDQIDRAVQEIRLAESLALKSDWPQAFKHALSASEASESTFELAVERLLNIHRTALTEIFFNKDMLAMLYFPDEHVFAIYVPLFVPVSFPLVTGLWHEISKRFARHFLTSVSFALHA